VQNPSAIFTAGFHGVAATEPIFWHEKSSSCQELRLPGLDRNGFRSVTQGSVRSTYQSDYLGIPQGKAADACRLKIKGECLSVKQCACFNERGATHVANSLGPHYLTLLC